MLHDLEKKRYVKKPVFTVTKIPMPRRKAQNSSLLVLNTVLNTLVFATLLVVMYLILK